MIFILKNHEFHIQVNSISNKKNRFLNDKELFKVPIRMNNEPLFRFANVN